MTNKVRGEIETHVGDQKFVLVPSFRRVSKLEATLGRSLMAVATSLSTEGLSLTDATIIVDTMAKGPKPSRDEIGNLIASNGLMSVVPLIQELFNVVLTGKTGDEDEDEDDAGNAEAEDSASDE